MELPRNRIAMVSPSHNAYSETFIQEQKKGLDGEIFYYYGGHVPTHLENYGKLLTPTITISSKIKRKLGITIFSPAEIALIHSLKRNNIQVVLAQYGPTANRLIKITKYLNIPLIAHFHGYDASVHQVVTDNNQYKDVFDSCIYIIAVSQSMRKRLLELGCPEGKVIYNPYGPNKSFSEVIPTFIEPTFIAIGRFVEKKAPYYTILAFQKVLQKFPEAKLIIGGHGPLYETCVNLVRHLKMEQNVSLPGILSREDFINYLETSLAFVQHSVTALSGDQEGTPVAILEASAAGLPVIATNHAGIPDVIIDGKTGFLVNEHDVDSMAEKMVFLLENKETGQEFGRKGKDIVKTHFTLEKHLQTLNDNINKAII